MRILDIVINNFMSIAHGTHSFDKEGIIQIIGINNDSPTSVSNGSGKSSFIEAIYWGITGKALRKKVSSDDVVNNVLGENTSVEINIEVNGVVYNIVRSRKDADLQLTTNGTSLTQGSMSATQDYIDGIIGMDATTLRRVMFFSQDDIKPFMEMTDSEIKTLFEECLGFSHLSKYLDIAKSRSNDIGSMIDENVRETRRIVDNIETASSEIDDLQSMSDRYVDEKEEKIASIKRQIDSEVKKELYDLSASEERLEYYSKKINELTEDAGLIDDMIDETIKSEYSNAVYKVSVLSSNLAKIKGRSISEKCDACGRAYDEDSVSTAMQNLINEVKQAQQELEDAQNYLKELQPKVDEQKDLSNLLDKKKEELADAKDMFLREDRHYNQAKIDNANIQAYNDSRDAKIKALQDHIDMIDIEKDPYIALIPDKEEKLAQMQEHRDKLLVELNELQRDLEDYVELEDIFGNKGVKNDILAHITPYLNDVVSKYITSLDDIHIYFSTVKELASGELRDKFSINVKNENGGHKYHLNSSGEKQKINLVASIAFHIFVKNFIGANINCIFLDEPLESLDEGSAEAVVNLLESLRDDFESVYIISHNNAVKDLVTESIIVEKTDGVAYVKS